MNYYTVATIEITDRAWVADYVANVTRLVERAGGTYLARTPAAEAIEGQPRPGIVLLIAWPSREAAMTFYESEDYRPYRQARQAGSRTEMLLVKGEDVTAMARLGRVT